jgi:hypothetical protein
MDSLNRKSNSVDDIIVDVDLNDAPLEEELQLL